MFSVWDVEKAPDRGREGKTIEVALPGLMSYASWGLPAPGGGDVTPVRTTIALIGDHPVWR